MAGMHEVIIKLDQRTAEGRVPWKTAVGESAFSARLGNLSVLISSSGGFIRLSVRNEKGTEIDSVESLDIGLSPGTRDRLTTIYSSARRTALDTDQTLAELIELLDDAPPVAPEKPAQDRLGRRS